MDDTLLTGSWDTTLKVLFRWSVFLLIAWQIWKITPSGVNKIPVFDFVDNESEVRCADLALDGNLAVSGTEEGLVSYFDVRTKSHVRQLRAHSSDVSVLKLTSDGRLLSGGSDGVLKVFDTSGQELFHIPLHTAILCLPSSTLFPTPTCTMLPFLLNF